MRLPSLFRPKKAAPPAAEQVRAPVGWTTIAGNVLESTMGAFQRMERPKRDEVYTYPPVYRCHSLIAGDISKLSLRIVQEMEGSVPVPLTDPQDQFVRTLRQPNSYQNIAQFLEAYILSKLADGNTVILKERDQNGYVRRLWPLDWRHVSVKVAPGGAVFYTLSSDYLMPRWAQNVTIPASEIIHDRMNCIYHPLIGVPPLTAAALSGSLGITAMKQAETFFINAATPSGFLTADEMTQDESERLAKEWRERYTGDNAGRVAVIGGGMKFVQTTIPNRDSQLVEQLKFSADMVGMAYGVSRWKMGLEAPPAFPNGTAALNAMYHSDTLHSLIVHMEKALTAGMELPPSMRIDVVEDDLLRMDKKAEAEVLGAMVNGKLMSTNEARRRLGLGPKPGGDAIFGQAQDYDIALLADRDPPPPIGGGSPIEDETDRAIAAMERATI